MATNDPTTKKGFVITDFFLKQTGISSDKVTTTGDSAAVLLGFPVGFALDIVIFAHSGIPSLTMAGVGSATALGLKKTFDTWRNRGNAKKQARRDQEEAVKKAQVAVREREEFHSKLKDNAGKFKELLSKKGENKLLDMFDRILELWDDGLMDDKEFAVEFEEVKKKYLTALSGIQHRS